jgi:hypothetical protein
LSQVALPYELAKIADVIHLEPTLDAQLLNGSEVSLELAIQI